MSHQNEPADPEIEKIKAQLKLSAIAIALTVAVFLFDLPMFIGIPIVGIGMVGIWYVLVKMNERSQNTCVLVLMASVLFSGMVSSGPARASADAKEWTQILNNIALVMKYAKQVQEYNTQLQQYRAQLRDLERNPNGIYRDNLGNLIDGVGRVMSAQNAIGGSMAKIDGEIAKNFDNEMMGSFSDKFKAWTKTSNDTLGGSMRAAGMHRDAYASDTQALRALFNQSQSSTGTVAAVQQLSALTTMQIQQSQKLGDLLATQNTATSTWMAAQTSKEQSAVDNDAAIRKGFMDAVPQSIPPLDTSKKTYKKLNLYSSQ